MSRQELREGRLVSSIAWPDDTYISTEEESVISMKVSMEPGEMGNVPWIRVEFVDGSYLYNCRHLATIKLE